MKYPTWEEIKNNFFWPKEPVMITEDMPTFMGVPHAKTAKDLEGADVVIIGSSYVAGPDKELWGVKKEEWAFAAKRVRQQSLHYRTGYITDFNLDVFEHLKVVDYGNPDFELPPFGKKNPEEILKAQASMEQKVNDVLDVGAVPIVIGQNSPCSSYAIAKPIAEHTKGNVGVVSLDAHWDINPIDEDTYDPRIAGAANWKQKMYDSHGNIHPKDLVEIGERGMLEIKDRVRWFLDQGAHFYSMWQVRQMGIEKIAQNISYAYENTNAVYAHFDMDVLGGAGPASADILGELAEPIGLSDYEIIRLAHEIGKRGVTGFSFICIPPGSQVIYRTIVYVIMYMLAGMVLAKAESN